MCSVMLSSSCSICATRCDNFVKNPVIHHGWGKDRIVAYGKRNISMLTCDKDDFNLITSNLWFSSCLASSNQLSHSCGKHKSWNIGSTESYIFHMQVLLEHCYIKMESSQRESCAVSKNKESLNGPSTPVLTSRT